MLVLASALAGLIAGLAAGGSLAGLAALRFRWPLVAVAALLLREAVFLPPLAFWPGLRLLYPAALALLAVWVGWHARRLPGLWLVEAGLLANLLVVAANGGRMPAAAGLGPAAGLLSKHGSFGPYVIAGPSTRLGLLADWIALPGPLGQLLPAGYSPGDLAIAAGAAVTLFAATRAGRPSAKGAGATPR